MSIDDEGYDMSTCPTCGKQTGYDAADFCSAECEVRWLRWDAIYIPGDPDASYTCITSDTRPGPWHAWLRASHHCFTFKDLPFIAQIEAATACMHMAEYFMTEYALGR